MLSKKTKNKPNKDRIVATFFFPPTKEQSTFFNDDVHRVIETMGYKSKQEQNHALVIGISSPSKSNHWNIKSL